jgi:hypothetical protein
MEEPRDYIADLYYSLDNENENSNDNDVYNDDPELTWEQKVQDYIEELEDLGWDWDAWDPCH